MYIKMFVWTWGCLRMNMRISSQTSMFFHTCWYFKWCHQLECFHVLALIGSTKCYTNVVLTKQMTIVPMQFIYIDHNNSSNYFQSRILLCTVSLGKGMEISESSRGQRGWIGRSDRRQGLLKKLRWRGLVVAKVGVLLTNSKNRY